MKRQKRILAGAAAMLLALGMIISCDTPANSGSSDGGSAGGSITLPEGNPEAESKLVGTWEREGNASDVYVLNKDGTCKITESYDSSEGTWSATDTELSIQTAVPTYQLASFKASVTGNTLTLTMIQDNDITTTFLREKGSGDSLEGTWKATDEWSELILEINTNSCTMTQTSFYGAQKTEQEYTGSREGDTLTLKEGVSVTTSPYTLSDGNTLILNPNTEYPVTYIKQQ